MLIVIYSDERHFYYSTKVTDSFVENYSVATRHIYEFQFGIIFQLTYALTGKHVTPVSVVPIQTGKDTRFT